MIVGPTLAAMARDRSNRSAEDLIAHARPIVLEGTAADIVAYRARDAFHSGKRSDAA